MATNSAALIMSIISQIEACDFERLYEIEQQAHLVPWSLGTLKNNQGERYLNLKLIATLFNIAIVPSHQGNGFGKLLLNELIARLKEKGVQTLWLEVRESNPARFLYEKIGFNEVDIRKNYYPKPSGGRENAVVMACYL